MPAVSGRRGLYHKRQLPVSLLLHPYGTHLQHPASLSLSVLLRSQICGAPDLNGSCITNCFCVATSHPTPLPTIFPTLIPTPKPTFSPPVARALLVGGSNATLLEINPTAKLVLTPSWSSADPQTTLTWHGSSTDHTEFRLVYRTNTLTDPLCAVPGSLVIKSDVLQPEKTYQFRFSLQNSDGATDTATVNLTVAKPPLGGYLMSNPRNGSASSDYFRLIAGNWTDDPGSLPLTYGFYYTLFDGRQAKIKAESTVRNISTRLPLGHGSSYMLPVVVHVSDIVGASTQENITVQSYVPPPLDFASLALDLCLEKISLFFPFLSV